MLGTTDYVAPEQALGHAVTAQSDLYSLGVVLFEMLTGDVPFHGENQVAVAMHHVRDDLPDVQRGAPGGLQRARRRSSTARPRRTSHDRYRRRRRADRRPRGRARDRDGAQRASRPARRRPCCASLPGRKRRRLPEAHPASRGAGSPRIALLARRRRRLFALLAERAERGTGDAAAQAGAAGLSAVSLGQNAANDYDPIGGDGEHPLRGRRRARRRPAHDVVDGDLHDGNLAARRRASASPRRHARGSRRGDLRSRRRTPGLSRRGLRRRPRRALPDGVHRPALAAGRHDPGASAHATRVDLDTAGTKYRYYLVWITTLPPGQEKVKIAEIALYSRPRGALGRSKRRPQTR